MILYHSRLSTYFEKFGIPIPVKDDRAQRVVQNLAPYVTTLNPDHIEALLMEDLLLVHQQNFVDDLYGKKLYQQLDNCFEFSQYPPDKRKLDIEAFRDHVMFQAAATVHSMNLMDQHNFVFHLGGGMHHAHLSQGRGFCLVNDIVIGIRKLQRSGKVKKAWVIDIDAHKGDGTAAVTQNDETIRTLSVHMAKGWPLDDPDCKAPWFIPSDIDIPIEENEESLYLQKLSHGLQELSRMGEADLCVVVAGSDPYELDALPSAFKLRLTKEQMLQRDLMVFHFLKEKNIPQFYVMGGGYGPHAWEVYYQFLNHLIEKKFI